MVNTVHLSAGIATPADKTASLVVVGTDSTDRSMLTSSLRQSRSYNMLTYDTQHRIHGQCTRTSRTVGLRMSLQTSPCIPEGS